MASETATYSLPKLPYAYNVGSRTSHISSDHGAPSLQAPSDICDHSEQRMEDSLGGAERQRHPDTDPQTYVTNLNSAWKTLSAAQKDNDIPTQIQLQSTIRFHGGGHINHSLFWQNLAPPNSAEANPSSAPKLSAAITQTFGDLESFKEKFKATLLGIQGSGWGWLVKFENENGRIGIVTTKDQDPIVGSGESVVLSCDLWEHTYYLQYLNGKAAYVDNIWSVINWKTAEERYVGKRDEAFAALKAAL